MRIKMKTTMSGPGGTVHSGTEITVSDDVGRDLVNGGYAHEIAARPPEAAVPGRKVEAAVSRKSGRK